MYVYPAVVVLISFLAYTAYPSHYAYFDGVACAIAVELGDWAHLVHGNHILYGVLGRVVYNISSITGLNLSALQCLNLLNSILASAGAGVLCLFLIEWECEKRLAALFSLAGAFSFTYWFWGTNAQVYSLSFFLLSLAVLSLSRQNPPVSPAITGALHALAVFGHILNVLFLPCAWWLIKRSRGTQKQARRAFLFHFLAFSGVIAAVYAVSLFLIVRPEDPAHALRWLLGSAALDPNKSFSWSGSFSLIDWIQTTVLLITAGPGFCAPKLPGGFSLFHTAFVWALLVSSVAILRKRRPEVVRFAAVWILPYAGLLLFWEPFNPAYRIGDIIPIFFLMAAALSSLGIRTQVKIFAAAALILFLAVNNFLFGVRPLMSRAANPYIQEMADIRKATRENSWIASLKGNSSVYIPYFARRKPLIIGNRIVSRDALSLSDPVYLTDDILETAPWSDFFTSRFILQKVQTEKITLYRLQLAE